MPYPCVSVLFEKTDTLGEKHEEYKMRIFELTSSGYFDIS